jgi:hypothetical protein
VNPIIRNLVDHLSAMGVPFNRIPSCVGALSCIVGENPSVSPLELNEGMRARGWKDFQGDDRILTLMLLLVAETLLEADAGKRMGFENHMRREDRPTLRLMQ